MQDLRWDDLRYFLAVVRTGNLSGAAADLGVNHSTAWRRLRSLEEALGATLFERTPQGHALTDAGEAMLPHAERVEEEVFALQRRVAATDVLPGGVVRVTAPESFLPLLAPLLLSFRQQHPRIRLDLTLGDRFYDLDRREADVAIRPSPQPPESAVGRRVAAVAWTLYGPAAAPADSPLPWVGYGEDLARLAASRWAREQLGDDPVLTVNTVPAMRSLLVRGDAQGMLPCFVGDREPALARRCAPIPQAASELWLLVHADLRRNARVRAFADHAWEALRELRTCFEGAA